MDNGLEAEAANPLIPFRNFGGQGRNRTTDTRIFNVKRTCSRDFQTVLNSLFSKDFHAVLWRDTF